MFEGNVCHGWQWVAISVLQIFLEILKYSTIFKTRVWQWVTISVLQIAPPPTARTVKLAKTIVNIKYKAYRHSI